MPIIRLNKQKYLFNLLVIRTGLGLPDTSPWHQGLGPRPKHWLRVLWLTDRARKEHSSQLKAQLKCPLSVTASLPLLNFPFPGSHRIYGNYSFPCVGAAAPAAGQLGSQDAFR